MTLISKIIPLFLFLNLISCANNSTEVTNNSLLDEIKYARAQKAQAIRVKLPTNFDIAKKYPLVILLHGRTGTSLELSALFDIYQKEQFIFAIPEGQYPIFNNNGFSWYSDAISKNYFQKFDIFSIQNIVEVVNELKLIYKIENIYIMGFSQGTDVGYCAALMNPNVFSGVASIGGFLPTISLSNSILTTEHIINSKNVKIFIARGSDDATSTRANYDMQVNYFIKNKFDVTEFEYAGNHILTKEVLDRFIKWLKEQ